MLSNLITLSCVALAAITERSEFLLVGGVTFGAGYGVAKLAGPSPSGNVSAEVALVESSSSSALDQDSNAHGSQFPVPPPFFMNASNLRNKQDFEFKDSSSEYVWSSWAEGGALIALGVCLFFVLPTMVYRRRRRAAEDYAVKFYDPRRPKEFGNANDQSCFRTAGVVSVSAVPGILLVIAGITMIVLNTHRIDVVVQYQIQPLWKALMGDVGEVVKPAVNAIGWAKTIMVWFPFIQHFGWDNIVNTCASYAKYVAVLLIPNLGLWFLKKKFSGPKEDKRDSAEDEVRVPANRLPVVASAPAPPPPAYQ
jgi:hypothetical protein